MARKAPAICNISTFESKIKDMDSAIVVFTQKDCDACTDYMPVLDSDIKEMAPVIKIPTDAADEGCIPLAAKYKAKGTPETLVFRNGKVVKRLIPDPAYKYKRTKDAIKKALGK